MLLLPHHNLATPAASVVQRTALARHHSIWCALADLPIFKHLSSIFLSSGMLSAWPTSSALTKRLRFP
jgi:hypothetical protein